MKQINENERDKFINLCIEIILQNVINIKHLTVKIYAKNHSRIVSLFELIISSILLKWNPHFQDMIEFALLISQFSRNILGTV